MIFTILLLLQGMLPKPFDTERYWVAWAGGMMIDGRSIPTIARLGDGRTAAWMPTEWLYCVGLEMARRSGLFPIFAISSAIAYSSLLWWTIFTCIRRRIGPEVTLLSTLAIGVAMELRFQIRAEDFAVLFLVVTLSLMGTRMGCFVLPPMFLVWANVHESVLVGSIITLLNAAGRLSRRNVVTAVACTCAATFGTPFGSFALWEHAWWFETSGLTKNIGEWEPTIVMIPTLWVPFLLVFVPLIQRWPRRRRFYQSYVGGILALIAGTVAARNIAPALAIAISSGFGGFRSTDLPSGLHRSWLRWVAIAMCTVGINTITLNQGPLERDPDFGLLLPSTSAPMAVPRMDVVGRRIACQSAISCNVVLFHGGRTIFDGRTEIFGLEVEREQGEATHDIRAFDRNRPDGLVYRVQDVGRREAPRWAYIPFAERGRYAMGGTGRERIVAPY